MMLGSGWFGLIILVAVWGAQVILRSSISSVSFKSVSPKSAERFFEFVFWASVLFIFAFASYASFLQYEVWAHGALTKFLLPPYQSIGYFLVYVGDRIFAPWLLALFAALIVSFLAERYNRKYNERFFEADEFVFMKIGFFLTGYPGFLFYFGLVLLAELIYSAFATFFRGERASVYFLWMPLAILAMIITHYAGAALSVEYFNI